MTVALSGRSSEHVEAASHVLMQQFGKMMLAPLAAKARISEAEVLVLARRLGLRQRAVWWDREQAAAWLGVAPHRLPAAIIRDGQAALVSTAWLRLWLRDNEAPDADAAFLAELDEAEANVPAACPSVSGAHTCLNPWAGPNHGLLCSGFDEKCRMQAIPIEQVCDREIGGLSGVDAPTEVATLADRLTLPRLR